MECAATQAANAAASFSSCCSTTAHVRLYYNSLGRMQQHSQPVWLLNFWQTINVVFIQLLCRSHLCTQICTHQPIKPLPVLSQYLCALLCFANCYTNQHQVSRVERYGVFVQLHRSQLRGLVHISQVEREFSKDLAKHYTPGQVVSVRCGGWKNRKSV